MFGSTPHFIYYNGVMYAKVVIARWDRKNGIYIDAYQGTYSGPGFRQISPWTAKTTIDRENGITIDEMIDGQ